MNLLDSMAILTIPLLSTLYMQNSDEKLSVYPAGFWRRLIAWVYDLLGGAAIAVLGLVAGLLILYFITLPWVDDFNAFTSKLNKHPLWAIYLLSCVIYYYAWCWQKGGQTVGMRAWRMKLIHPDGELLSWKKAIIRALASLGGLGMLWSPFDKRKRGWQDIAVDSIVVVLPKGYEKREEKPLI